MSVHAVILAGGGGTRLWPLSRTQYPKQFLPLLEEYSLLQRTVVRMRDMVPPERLWIVTGQEHSFAVQSQLDEIGQTGHILTEPQGRNTAAAIGLAAYHIQHRDPDAVMVVLPADHWVERPQALVSIIQEAVSLARARFLVTLGILPHQPDTSYGYICRGRPLSDPSPRTTAYTVTRFVEKPDQPTAQKYVDSGDYYWNAGIFVWQTEIILQEIATHLPALFHELKNISAALQSETEKNVVQEVYARLEAISIDHGVLEKSSRLAVVPADIGWSDLGKWSAIYQILQGSHKDERGNVLSPNVLDKDSENSLLYSTGRTIATLGLKDIVVVDTEDALLICSQARTHEVGALVQQLKDRGDATTHTPHTVRRPWGTYTVLAEGPHSKVKRVVMRPGGRLSLQLHTQRSEHWVVVSGIATVIRGDEEFTLTPNQSTHIPQGTRHRLSNREEVPLEIIEVQTGAYVGEDDIVRFEDVYARK